MALLSSVQYRAMKRTRPVASVSERTKTLACLFCLVRVGTKAVEDRTTPGGSACMPGALELHLTYQS